jgi:hypothetical protein
MSVFIRVDLPPQQIFWLWEPTFRSGSAGCGWDHGAGSLNSLWINRDYVAQREAHRD